MYAIIVIAVIGGILIWVATRKPAVTAISKAAQATREAAALLLYGANEEDFVSIVPPATITSQSELEMYEAIDIAVAANEGYADIVRGEVGPAWDLAADTPGRTEAMAAYWEEHHPGEKLPLPLTPGYIGMQDLSNICAAIGTKSHEEAKKALEAEDPRALAVLDNAQRETLVNKTSSGTPTTIVGTIDMSVSSPLTESEEATLDAAIKQAQATGGTVGITSGGQIVIYAPGDEPISYDEFGNGEAPSNNDEDEEEAAPVSWWGGEFGW